MSPADVVKAWEAFAHGRTPSLGDAKKICGMIDSYSLTFETAMGPGVNGAAVAPLREAFPQFAWRVALDRTGERTRAFVTIEVDDPREHYRDEDWCPKCGGDHTEEEPSDG